MPAASNCSPIPPTTLPYPSMKRWPLVTAVTVAFALMVGCATLEEKQGAWIFQPIDRTWGGYGAAEGMQDTWIVFDSERTGKRVKLHALWLAADAKPASGEWGHP